MEIIKGRYKSSGQMLFILSKSEFLSAKRNILNVLNFESNSLAGDAGQIYLKLCLHRQDNFIIFINLLNPKYII
jgi:hypothetical protein